MSKVDQLSPSLHLYQGTGALQKAGQKLNELFGKNSSREILFLTSGGSAFALLDFVSSDNLSENVTASVLDERFSHDPKVNNFAQLRETYFYQLAQKNNCSFISTDTVLSMEELAENFDKELKRWKLNHPDGVVIATLGMGEDGHTAGIMPFPGDPQLFANLFEQAGWIVGYDAKGKNPYPLRITATPTFLKEIVDYSVVFISGEKKLEKMKQLVAQEKNLAELPALVLWQMKDVFVFTDLDVV